MILILLTWLCAVTTAIGQSQQCSNQVQICAPISSYPDGIPQNAISMEKSIAEIKEEVDSLSQRLNELTLSAAGSQSSRIDSCPRIKYDFPRQRQTSDYARYRRYVPRLDAGTACLWINATDVSHDLSLLSYAISRSGNNNFLLYYIANTQIMRFHVGTVNVDLPLTLTAHTLTHLCAWFDSSSRILGYYLNGEFGRQAHYSGTAMSGGGSMLLAQEQDAVGGRFDASQSFTGEIESPMMWPRVLTAKEVGLIAIKCICPSDYVVSMTRDTMELYGRASYSVPDQCQSLK